MHNSFLDFDFSYLIEDDDTFSVVDSSETALNNYYRHLYSECLTTTVLQKNIDIKKIKKLNDIEDRLGVDFIYSSMIIQKPGSINCVHVDHFHRLKKNKDNAVRVNIFISEWSFGQLVQTPEKTFSNWNVGEWCIWNNQVKHFALNFSDTDKITLQLSGLLRQ